ncbi:unnamed protein product [Zymoseptoria tritici ST99CH_3D7]|uniref:Uncharacterized protein n=1 Tax=Zymoseptoria tritici (strain ST99CH_3D7) TaxID=1276538 RepID=A0A1X7S9E7_ZYMT9|nr:unnamed protein product [Zymoseptoria tritici ST99CH_3D7]
MLPLISALRNQLALNSNTTRLLRSLRLLSLSFTICTGAPRLVDKTAVLLDSITINIKTNTTAAKHHLHFHSRG